MRAKEFLFEYKSAPTNITPIQAVISVLGQDRVTTDRDSKDLNKIVLIDGSHARIEDELRKGKKQTDFDTFTKKEMDKIKITMYPNEANVHSVDAAFRHGGKNYPARIYLPSFDNSSAVYVAVAVHEAYHAKIYLGTRGQGALTSNEKIVNDLTEKWLRSKLSGFALHAGLTTVANSRSFYRSIGRMM